MSYLQSKKSNKTRGTSVNSEKKKLGIHLKVAEKSPFSKRLSSSLESKNLKKELAQIKTKVVKPVSRNKPIKLDISRTQAKSQLVKEISMP